MRCSYLFAVLVSFHLFVMAAYSQQIKIVVVDSHRGKPVIDECINISLGPWHGADLLAATDKDGVILMSFDHGEVTVPPPIGRRCGGLASTKPLEMAPTQISVLPDWYVSCQYSTKLAHDPAWLNATSSQRIPSFVVQKILEGGAVATNSCSKFAPLAEPGKLILIVRKRTFLEGMRS